MKEKKYYIVTLSTNCDEQGLFNQSMFVDGYELPSFEELTRELLLKVMGSKRSHMATRALKVMFFAGARTVGDLRKVCKTDLLRGYCGKGTLTYIEDFAEECGIEIGSDLI